jgi:hypothetical protein
MIPQNPLTRFEDGFSLRPAERAAGVLGLRRIELNNLFILAAKVTGTERFLGGQHIQMLTRLNVLHASLKGLSNSLNEIGARPSTQRRHNASVF